MFPRSLSLCPAAADVFMNPHRGQVTPPDPSSSPLWLSYCFCPGFFFQFKNIYDENIFIMRKPGEAPCPSQQNLLNAIPEWEVSQACALWSKNISSFFVKYESIFLKPLAPTPSVTWYLYSLYHPKHTSVFRRLVSIFTPVIITYIMTTTQVSKGNLCVRHTWDASQLCPGWQSLIPLEPCFLHL